MILQVNKPEQLFFHQRTDTFDLSITLTGQQKLSINLQDFVDWIIYSKEYTEEDIGKEIHKKMEIIDVYTSFAQTRPQCDEEKSMKEKQHQIDQLKKYEFGTIVENENLPCYKIQKDGKIAAYMSLTDKRSKQEVIYESKLILNKVRNMTEIEIAKEKSTNEKNQIHDELSKEIQKEKKEKQEQAQRVAKLEEQLKSTKQELTTRNQQLKQELQSTILQLTSAKQELEATRQQQQQNNGKLDANINSTKQVMNSAKEKLEAVIQELLQSSNQIRTSKSIDTATQQQYNLLTNEFKLMLGFEMKNVDC